MSTSTVVCSHSFGSFEGSLYVIRYACTPYSLMDLCYAYRSANFELLKDILLSEGASSSLFSSPNWFDPIEDINSYVAVMDFIKPIVLKCLLSTITYTRDCVSSGVIGCLCLDNQNLNGNWLDFGDFHHFTSQGVVSNDTYYSYLLPLCGACQVFSDVFDHSNNLNLYDFTNEKLRLFSTYLAWDISYHPNCSDCVDEYCLLKCSNFNVLFGMYINPVYLGPIVSSSSLLDFNIPHTIGYTSIELGVVLNIDTFPTDPILQVSSALGTPPLHLAASTPTYDHRVSSTSYCLGSVKNSTSKLTPPGYANDDFIEHCKDILYEGSPISLKHFFFMQERSCGIIDFDYYRYNRPTVFDPLQFRFVYQVVKLFLQPYEAKCIPSSAVVVTNPRKSSGFPFSSVSCAGEFLDFLGDDRIDQLYSFTKRGILPTFTKVNVKSSISGKERARTVSGVGILSTATNRCCHQFCLKQIAAGRDLTIVLGTPKFYGNWDNMLRRFCDDKPRQLFGWDYPKCDRSMPCGLRSAAAWLLINKHNCCSPVDKFFRLANECSQVLNETCLVNGTFYRKPGGTSSGDATTAYANSIFNLFQVVTSTVNRCLNADIVDYRPFISNLHDNIYSHSPSNDFVLDYFNFLSDTCPLMILSDDGIAGPRTDHPLAVQLSDFSSTLYYQNNVVLTESKCWVEPDPSKGPHEFCSQHTIVRDGKFFPIPDPSRILSACVFTATCEKADPQLMIGRFVSLAIDAYPLIFHSDPIYRLVFPTILTYIRKISNLNITDMYMIFSEYVEHGSADITSEDFYRRLYYPKPSILQVSSTTCVVCSTPTILSCCVCPRSIPLCASCLYFHISETQHTEIATMRPLRCHDLDCTNNSSLTLSYDGADGRLRCSSHLRSKEFLPLVDNTSKVVFSLGSERCAYSPHVHKYNKCIISNFSAVEDYDSYSLPPSCHLALCELAKFCEESQKRSFGTGVVTEVVSSNGTSLCTVSWTGPIPPITLNSKFSAVSGRSNYGDYVLQRSSSGSHIYTYTSFSGQLLRVGCTLTLLTHNVHRLTANPLPTNVLNVPHIDYQGVHSRYSQQCHFDFFSFVYSNVLTTVQGPPGTGKSFTICGLPYSFPSSRILYTAASHAAVDAICHKLMAFGHQLECSRLKSLSSHHRTFTNFAINDNSRRIICSTINTLPNTTVDICVVDEVSMTTDADLSLLMSRVRAKRFVYVGDPQQLSSPRTLCSSTVPPLLYNSVIRLMLKKSPSIFLSTCFRCPKEIVSVCSSKFYDSKLTSHKPVSDKCFSVLISKGERREASSHGCYNPVHISYIRDFISNYPEFSESIFISPYHLMNTRVSTSLGLRTSTVESCQGDEFDYVIYSQTSSSSFASNPQRYNVAISRARLGILVVAFSSEFDDFSVPPLCPPHNFKSSRLQSYLSTKGSDKGVMRVDSSFACNNLAGCIALDTEFVHSVSNNPPCSYLLQIGLSSFRTFELAVKPSGLKHTDTGLSIVELSTSEYRYAPKFYHLSRLVKRAVPWSTFRHTVLSHIAKSTQGVVTFLTWCDPGDIRQLTLLIRYGVEKNCSCNRLAVFCNHTCSKFYCQSCFSSSSYFLYNPRFFDIQDCQISLSTAHSNICATNHGSSHFAGSDAASTFCLFISKFFSPTVDWSLTTPRDSTLNRYLRKLAPIIINTTVPSTHTILDVGNPKGLSSTKHRYIFVDSNPLSTSVIKHTYNSSSDLSSFPHNYSLFWNCNVVSYPNNAIVCRLTSPSRDPRCRPGPNGSFVYLNKHVFFQNNVFDVSNLVRWSFCYTDDLPCSSDFVPGNIPINKLLTPCNKGTLCCKSHYDAFFIARTAYDYVTSHSGFDFYVPKPSSMQSLTVALSSLAIGSSTVSKNHPRLNIDDFSFASSVVSYKGRPIFSTNNTTIPISVSLESYVYRCVSFIPNAQTLSNLGVTNFVDFSTWGTPLSTSSLSTLSTFVPVTDSTISICISNKVPYKSFSGLLVSQQPFSKISSKFMPGTLAGCVDSVPTTNSILTYLTFFRFGDPVSLSSSYFSLNRTLSNFSTCSQCEIDFLTLSPSAFIYKYDLYRFNLHHIVYGDLSSPTVGGLHLLISLFRHNRSSDLSFNELTVSPLATVRTCHLVCSSSTKITTFVDVELSSYIDLLKSLTLDCVSATPTFNIDYSSVKFMEWVTNPPTPSSSEVYSLTDNYSSSLDRSYVVTPSTKFVVVTNSISSIVSLSKSHFSYISPTTFGTYSNVTFINTTSLLPTSNYPHSLFIFVDVPSNFVDFVLDSDIVLFHSEFTKDFNTNFLSSVSSFPSMSSSVPLGTFYPLATQSNKPLSVHRVLRSILTSYVDPHTDIPTIDIPNYGETFSSSYTDRVGFCFLKYTQLLQYLNDATTFCRPGDSKLNVLNLGASDKFGHSPGSDAIRSFFSPLNSSFSTFLLHDLDVVPFTSGSTESFVTSVETFRSQVSYDLIISDIYNADSASYFSGISVLIKRQLSYGGSFCIKFTETRHSQLILDLCSQCAWWGCIMTSCNTSSSECFIVGINYNPATFSFEPLPIHTFLYNYASYRNDFSLRPSFSSLISPKGLKSTQTVTVCYNESDGAHFTRDFPGLISSGQLLIRRNLS
uniref:Replicase polyprotein 1ab n=1 Tax=Galaxias nidovirus TaxID=3064102 RepID=A0AA49X5N5_9NIDO|nr:MAG: RdRp [Galaxias nidovirus]WLJ60761.1 MAG: ORF1b [Galaxias nidovirus]